MHSSSEFSVVRTTSLDQQLRDHLLRADGQEDIAFVTWQPSTGARRTTAVLQEVLLPERGDRQVHGTASFNPAYYLRAVEHAEHHNAGLALIHSHPGGRGWQRMSRQDETAERDHAAQTQAVTGLPLVGMTLAGGDDTVSARLWTRTDRRRYDPRWAVKTRTAGSRFQIAFNDELVPAPQSGRTHTRTVSAWGPKLHADIARLRVGVVGLGSVGALVAEALVRTGVGEVVLIDFDTIRVHNLDRTLHANWLDVVCRRSKVEISARALRRDRPSGHTRIRALEDSIVEVAGFRAALDCDVLFSCVDRPWPREILNTIAYAHVIPVVDGGINVPAPGRRWMGSAAIGAHVAAPGRRCLACLEQYTPSGVTADIDGSLDDPKYLADLPEGHRWTQRQNVFAFAQMCSALEMSQFISMIAGPNPHLEPQRYNLGTGEVDLSVQRCEDYCEFPTLVAAGDRADVILGVHEAAREERRRRSRAGWSVRGLRLADDLLRTARRWIADLVATRPHTD